MVKPKCIDEILSWFSMETPRKGSCRMEEVDARLSVLQTLDELNAWAFFFVIMYAMLCTQTRYVVCSECYGHIPEWSHVDLWTILWISLSTLEELRICFVCRGDKRSIVRCYIGASFVTDTNNLSQLGYVFNKRWHNGLEGGSMLDLDEFQS